MIAILKFFLFIIIVLLLIGISFIFLGSMCHIGQTLCNIISTANSYTLLVFGISFTAISIVVILIILCVFYVKCC